MAIFQAIPTDKGGDTIRAAQKEIINRANANHLTTEGWSLAELRLDDDDVAWLHAWARALDEDTANRWLSPGHTAAFWGNPQTRRVGIGVLLMLLAAEQIRRTPVSDPPSEKPNESNWAATLSASFEEETRKVLIKDGALAPSLIGSFKEAGHRLRLRMGGDWSTATAQRDNIGLQIALTEADLPYRLPIWLNGDYVPEYITALLDPVDGSDSFLHLWLSCQDFMKGVLSESELRQTLLTSVWVLPHWVDMIVGTLRPSGQREADPARSPSGQESSPSLTPHETTDEALDVFGSFMPYGGVKTIIRAVCAMLNRADKLGIRGQPWSPAELQITDYDYAWLRVWVTRLEPETVSFIAETEGEFEAGEAVFSIRAALGGLLALWIVETARRRENGDDELWSFIASDGFKPAVAAELFRENRPSSFLRVLLTAAARELNLRETLPTAS